jgi:small basic protein (TIGR04137 family)
MSIDRSLKIKGALTRHRNVLSRNERIEALLNEDRWEEGDDVTGLPKVGHRKVHASSSKKENAEEDEEGAEAVTES